MTCKNSKFEANSSLIHLSSYDNFESENLQSNLDNFSTLDPVDVTNLIQKKKRLNQTLPAIKFCEPGLTDDELSVLVTTINQMSLTEKPEYGSLELEEQPPNQSNIFNPYNVPYFSQDEKIFCHGYSLKHWRKLFMSLTLADSYTLENYVNAMPYSNRLDDSNNANKHFNKKNNSGNDDLYPCKHHFKDTNKKNIFMRPPPSEGRFKQIARGKSTKEYLHYAKVVPRENRTEDDPVTPRVAGSSWREFQQEIRNWKRSLHRKYESLVNN